MSKKRNLVLFSSLAMVLTACGGGNSPTYSITGNRYIPDTYEGKRTYNALLGVPLEYLNTAVTMNAADAEHIANFVDGLVENDMYGRLSKALAEKVEVNADHDEYKFTLKSGIPWITSSGDQYEAMVGGKKVKQYVTAEDFVFAVKQVLNFENDSEAYYLPAMFLENGYEYYAYTYAVYLRDTNQDVNTLGFKISNDALLVAAINIIGDLVFDVTLNVTTSLLSAISNFSRVGVKASVENGKSVVTFKLQNPSYYFLSVLTYSPFLPINENFFKQVGPNNFGYSKDNFLYNGAFICKEWTENSVVYQKNEKYWDADKVHINSVNYSVLNNSISNDFVRKEFESGRIDAFGVSRNDTEGWNKYVAGPDGTGTLENPASDLAYSREIEVVDSSFVFMINANRNASNSSSISAGSSTLTTSQLTNTDNALKINAVRELILNGIDMNVFNKRWGTTDELLNQYQMWTYVPKGFATSNTGNDYVEYIYSAYAEEFGMDVEDVRTLLKQGQVPYTSNDQTAKVALLAQKAKDAIAAINADGGVIGYKSNGGYNHTAKTQITYPIKIEYLGIPDDEQKMYDAAWIEKFNEDANVCTTNANHVSGSLPLCSNNTYPYFELVSNTKVTLNTYSQMGEYGQYHLYIMGWGADYADPLTYLNTFTTGGEFSAYTGIKEATPDYIVSESGVVTRLDNISETYDSLVASGRVIYDNDDNRYTYFGKAEVELIFNCHIMQPLYMQGQGWSVSVSKAAGYEKPTAAYGLSSYKLKGVYILTEPMLATDRFAAKALYNADKAEALADDSYDIYN